MYEDDKPVEMTHFSAERVPVSLGIALDTSGSMAGEQDETPRAAPWPASLTSCSTERTSCFSIASATIRRWCRDGRTIAGDLLAPWTA